MYKPKYVTRTIKTKTVCVLWADLGTRETYEREETVPGSLSSEDEILEYLRHKISDGVRPVHIVSQVENETLYKMQEEVFIKYAENACADMAVED